MYYVSFQVNIKYYDSLMIYQKTLVFFIPHPVILFQMHTRFFFFFCVLLHFIFTVLFPYEVLPPWSLYTILVSMFYIQI